MKYIEKYALLAKETNKLKVPKIPTEIAKTPNVMRPTDKAIDITDTTLDLPDVNKNGIKPLFTSGL